ncbi:MAG: hypothetical protein JWN52_4647 [Actinomycetia bacterium]|nr:hypothetical protein [Actinomycetes bacterium]
MSAMVHDLRMGWSIGDVPTPGSRVSVRPLLYLDIDGVLNPEAPLSPSGFQNFGSAG